MGDWFGRGRRLDGCHRLRHDQHVGAVAHAVRVCAHQSAPPWTAPSARPAGGVREGAAMVDEDVVVGHGILRLRHAGV
jgi:hypothetical protein